jgi:hypothetical protein
MDYVSFVLLLISLLTLHMVLLVIENSLTQCELALFVYCVHFVY